jgi:Zn-dependent peptidase ImmA (M78 family)
MVKRQVNTTKTIVGGHDGLRISLEWDQELSGDTASKATGGKCNLWIGDKLVWGHEDPETKTLRAVHWDWIELLEFLIDSLDYIVYEETYPVPLNPTHPGKLRAQASQRWESMSESRVLEEETEIYYFEECHDLAKSLQGIFLPTVFLMREGNQMWVGTEGYYRLCPFAETRKTLEKVGNLISQRLEALEDPRAKWALSEWQNRNNLLPEQRVSIVTGLSKEEVGELSASLSFERFWECDAANQERFEITELQAAARMMTGKLSVVNMRPVLERIRGIQRVNTPELDKLAQQAVAFLNTHVQVEFYEQGYQLATWLREQLVLQQSAVSSGKLDSKALLSQWGVLVQELELPEANRLDAIACWGPRHGPAVLLNLNSLRHQKPAGRSATYAHELCHLLVDRAGALPLVEIFGGRLPGGAESRANAFAAELLLPRSIAAATVSSKLERTELTELKELLAQLSSEYGVSYHLIANQILNSSVQTVLTIEERNYLEEIRIKYQEE